MHDFVCFKKCDELPPDAPELLTMNNVIDLNAVIEQIYMASDNWANAFPHMKSIWLIPHPINFAQYNQILVSNAGFQINLDDYLQEKHEQDAKTFYKVIEQLKNLWRERLKGIPFIYLHELFFRKAKKDSFVDESKKCIWPKGFTVDGVHPSEKLARVFWNCLWRWMKTLNVDPKDIVQQKALITEEFELPKEETSIEINGQYWLAGDFNFPLESFPTHLDRLKKLHKKVYKTNGVTNEEPNSKRLKLDGDADDVNSELTHSINTVKANIMKILQAKTNQQENEKNKNETAAVDSSTSSSFSLNQAMYSLEELLDEFDNYSEPLKSLIDQVSNNQMPENEAMQLFSTSDNQKLLSNISSMLICLEQQSDNEYMKSKYTTAIKYTDELAKRSKNSN